MLEELETALESEPSAMPYSKKRQEAIEPKSEKISKECISHVILTG